MPYAAIMVEVGDDAASSGRVTLAAHLSVRLRCRLIGVAARMPRAMPLGDGDIGGYPLPGGDIAGGDGDLYQYQIEAIDNWLEQQGRRFRDAAAPIQPDIEWRSATDFPVDFVAAQARAADLVVIAQGRSRQDPYHSLDSGAALLNMGRPVLTVPPGIEAVQAERVVVAWKDVREARRAVREALPLLREAKEVFVIEASDEGAESPAQKRVDDVSAYLARHRVNVAAASVEPVRTTAAAQLIGVARARQADLIVAGAYGHSRLGEWIFGGVTRELLRSSPICCLFSH
jgi:nucleotide-binding universal stress UspA family protein